MAKRKKKKLTKFDNFCKNFDEVFDKYAMMLCGFLFKPIFSLFAFILWRNKYSKQYWERKKSWRKTMRRLRSRAQKDIILTAIIPTLEKQGFQRNPSPTSWWGWNYCIQGYDYTLVRLKDDELQRVEIVTFYGKSYFRFQLNVFRIIPNITDVAEWAEYDYNTFFPEIIWPSERKDINKYKLRAFSSEKELEKKVRRLKLKFEKWASNIDKEFEDWRKDHSPAIIDINQKIKEHELRQKEEAANKHEVEGKSKRSRSSGN